MTPNSLGEPVSEPQHKVVPNVFERGEKDRLGKVHRLGIWVQVHYKESSTGFCEMYLGSTQVHLQIYLGTITILVYGHVDILCTYQ